jgi:hypothetical protein
MNSSEKARVDYWLDREYIATSNSTPESCIAMMQRKFPGIPGHRLAAYLDAYLKENRKP